MGERKSYAPKGEAFISRIGQFATITHGYREDLVGTRVECIGENPSVQDAGLTFWDEDNMETYKMLNAYAIEWEPREEAKP